jgi:SAM-dependent methyltransferase
MLRRTEPLSDIWGWDRGSPVDRYYIERFLAQHRELIRGRVLEVGDSRYTEHFGTGVIRSDILDIAADNPAATLVGDLSADQWLPESCFDCVILVQTLQYIFNLEAAVRAVHRALKPGGVVLCTLPSVTRIGRRYLESDLWRFTSASARGLFGGVFDQGVEVEPVGNLLACTAFLAGLAAEELSEAKLAVRDPYFPLLVTVSAMKRST